MPDSNDFKMMKARLEGVSPSLCLAKWLQVTIHLQNGHTHSCHHPISRQVPEGEVAAHPDALHNSEFKMQRRKEMLEGKRPEECLYCWKIEDLSSSLLSDRTLKSSEDWAAPRFDDVVRNPWDWRVSPAYVEVSFSNICNFKCAYCNGSDSSKWMEELREQGSYPTREIYHDLDNIERKGRTPIAESESNPYTEAFWKWWPELYPSLRVFRITGGEPLLTKQTFRVLDYVSEHPRPDLALAVNSNLGVPQSLIEQFVEKVEALTEGGKVKSFSLYTSIDTWGRQAEYIRYGMNFETYWKNIRAILGRLKKIDLILMSTVNVMSVIGLRALLDGLLELKKEFGSSRVQIDLPYLRDPAFLSARILPPEFASYFDDCLEFMKKNTGPHGFGDLEIARMLRVRDWFRAPIDPVLLGQQRNDFVRFIATYDQRRGVRFTEVFPELRRWYSEIVLELTTR